MTIPDWIIKLYRAHKEVANSPCNRALQWAVAQALEMEFRIKFIRQRTPDDWLAEAGRRLSEKVGSEGKDG